MFKCYECVIAFKLLAEARALGYPLRMIWMVISSYRCPRLVQAFGSLSRSVVSYQGILAGCGHANTMMHLLLHRIIVRFSRFYPTITPRVLMDDASFQWVSKRIDLADILLAAVRWFSHQVFKLGLVLQVSKSGFVATAARASSRVSSSARILKLRSYTHMRNLGHEVFSGRPQRAQERARLKKVIRRRPKLAALRRGAPGKYRCPGGPA